MKIVVPTLNRTDDKNWKMHWKRRKKISNGTSEDVGII